MYIDIPTNLHKELKLQAQVEGLSLRVLILDILASSLPTYDKQEDKHYQGNSDNWQRYK